MDDIVGRLKAMDLEEVVKDEDSEDEINEGARVVEEKRVRRITQVIFCFQFLQFHLL